MIAACKYTDFERMLWVINDGAKAYRGQIPSDRWQDPYMNANELRSEIEAKVTFRGWYNSKKILVGVMGSQHVLDVLLIRHAYVISSNWRQGIGSALIDDLLTRAISPVLVGTWASATWAIEFYQKHGFELVSKVQKERLLRKYWTISDRQIETSVVLNYAIELDGEQSPA